MTVRIHRHATWFAICLLAAAGAGLGHDAQAQVMRCTDARTGRVTYTDGACPGQATAREVEPRKTPQELQLERQQAAEALERKQQRLESEAAAAALQAQRDADRERAQAARVAARQPQPHDYARSPECARSRRALDIVASGIARSTYEQELRMEAAQQQVDLDCLGPEGYAEVEKARSRQPRVVVVPPVVHSGPRPLFPEPFPQLGRPEPPRRITECGDFRCTDNLGNTYPRTGPGRFPGAAGQCRSAGGQAPC